MGTDSDMLNLERLCKYTRDRLGDVPPTKLNTILFPMGTAFLKILAATYVPDATHNLNILLPLVARDASAQHYKGMLKLREEGARIFNILGAHPRSQTAPAPAAAYAIHLIAGIYNDPNSRLSIHSLVESMRWLHYAGVSTESMSGIVNLLLT